MPRRYNKIQFNIAWYPSRPGKGRKKMVGQVGHTARKGMLSFLLIQTCHYYLQRQNWHESLKKEYQKIEMKKASINKPERGKKQAGSKLLS